MTDPTTAADGGHRPFPVQARGPLSTALLAVVDAPPAYDEATTRLGDLERALPEALQSADAVRDEDLQLTLFLLYAIGYGSFDQAGAEWEWHPALIATRTAIETVFEDRVRRLVGPVAAPAPRRDEIAAALFEMTAPTPGPSLARFVARRADAEQARELLVQRSIYTLREADAHSWAIPRLTGRAKAALAEIQSDEYGGGDPERVHQVMYARTMRGAGLDDRYGAYVDAVPALTLASFNLMTMFGVNRRLRGAAVGHLAAFEMTSSIPCRFIAEGLRRLSFGDDVAAYYDEHVEADAVHEQIAGRDLAGSLGEDEPHLIADILFGAAACLAIDGAGGDEILAAWQDGRSSLREPVAAIRPVGAVPSVGAGVRA